jgi:hypothetical protein
MSGTPRALAPAAADEAQPPPACVDAPVPQLGVSLAAVRAFAAAHAGRSFSPAREEGADARALPFEELSTAQVVLRVVKPATADARCSYAELLLTQGARDAAGLPHVGAATVFVSHAWAYSFADLLAALESRFGEANVAPGDAAAAPYAALPGTFMWLGAPR